jgi:hypothetical protein
MITLLDEYIGAKSSEVSGRFILGLLYWQYDKGIKTIKEVYASMYWILHQKLISPDENSSCIALMITTERKREYMAQKKK